MNHEKKKLNSHLHLWNYFHYFLNDKNSHLFKASFVTKTFKIDLKKKKQLKEKKRNIHKSKYKIEF